MKKLLWSISPIRMISLQTHITHGDRALRNKSSLIPVRFSFNHHKLWHYWMEQPPCLCFTLCLGPYPRLRQICCNAKFMIHLYGKGRKLPIRIGNGINPLFLKVSIKDINILSSWFKGSPYVCQWCTGSFWPKSYDAGDAWWRACVCLLPRGRSAKPRGRCCSPPRHWITGSRP